MGGSVEPCLAGFGPNVVGVADEVWFFLKGEGYKTDMVIIGDGINRVVIVTRKLYEKCLRDKVSVDKKWREIRVKVYPLRVVLEMYDKDASRTLISKYDAIIEIREKEWKCENTDEGNGTHM